MAENEKKESKPHIYFNEERKVNLKNTSKFMNEIKNYDKLRELLRHLYMYGVYTKNDLLNKNLSSSPKTLNNWLARFKNYVGKNNVNFTKAPYSGKKIVNIRFDPYTCPYNFLADTYKNKSVVVEDILIYYYTFMAFEYFNIEYNETRLYNVFKEISNKEYLTLENIEDFISYCCYNDKFSVAEARVVTRDKIKKRLKEFVDMGLLELVKVPKSVTSNLAYRLSNDIIAEMEPNKIEDLALAVQFFYNYLFFSIPGYYLYSTLKQEESYLAGKQNGLKGNITKGLYSLQDENIFLFPQPSIQNTMDDNILWNIFESIDKLSPIEFNYKNQNNEIDKVEAFPIKVIIEKQYGRHYLYAYSYSHSNFAKDDYRARSYQTYRIDNIFNLKTIKKGEDKFEFLTTKNAAPTYDEIDSLYKMHNGNLWNVTFSLEHDFTKVLLHFNFPIDEVSRLYARLELQKRHGIITKISDTKYDFSIEVQSEYELKPWIKSWGNRVTVDQDTNPELYKQIMNDREEALKLYGII